MTASSPLCLSLPTPPYRRLYVCLYRWRCCGVLLRSIRRRRREMSDQWRRHRLSHSSLKQGARPSGVRACQPLRPSARRPTCRSLSPWLGAFRPQSTASVAPPRRGRRQTVLTSEELSSWTGRRFTGAWGHAGRLRRNPNRDAAVLGYLIDWHLTAPKIFRK